MPRISRFATKFFVQGKAWIATFHHRHDEGGFAFLHPRTGKTSTVQHVTECRLAGEDGKFAIVGFSLCSKRDKYNWQLGINRSLKDALSRAGLCELDNYGEATALKPEYGIAMSSFYTELKVKDYAPHNLAGNMTPTANRQGLAYAGCD